MCALNVMGQMSWVWGNGQSISLLHNNWLADLLLNYWPTFISMEIEDQGWVSDLLGLQGRDWCTQQVTSFLIICWLKESSLLQSLSCRG